jgi:glycosyltransferase involved in cell wall biosynthesis
MISVVFSTRKENTEYQNHIKKTIGVKDYQIIEIVNDGQYSLTEAYNKGLKESTNDIVAFIHDDLILPNGWGKKMLSHFNNSEYGILGVAGTTDMSENGQWWKDSTKMVGIVKHSHNGRTWESKYSASFGKEIIETIIVDGLFFVVNKNRIKSNFSEDVKGFHFYDIDFTFNNHLNGVKIGVVFDVRIIHKSIGQTNEEWEKNRINFVAKYKDKLPYNIKPEIRFKNKEIKLKTEPKLSIIIPTKGKIDMLLDCVKSIYDKDPYVNKVVYIADTGSTDDEINEN